MSNLFLKCNALPSCSLLCTTFPWHRHQLFVCDLNVALSLVLYALNLCSIFIYIAATTTATCEQQQPQMKAAASNGSGSKVLHRVISLTTANHNDSSNYAKPAKPSFIPEKLQFSAYEKFEGEHTLMKKKCAKNGLSKTERTDKGKNSKKHCN